VEPRFSAVRNRTFRRILQEVTALDIHIDASRILMLDDPELFKYPIAFMWEPGFWKLTDVEAASFRAYLLKGGFAVFEDFDGAAAVGELRAQMQRVLPDGRFVKLDQSHRIFDSFFEIETSTPSCTRCPHIRRAITGSSRTTIRRSG
jgi:hypothetical protein